MKLLGRINFKCMKRNHFECCFFTFEASHFHRLTMNMEPCNEFSSFNIPKSASNSFLYHVEIHLIQRSMLIPG
jgi:hypothetical protein